MTPVKYLEDLCKDIKPVTRPLTHGKMMSLWLSLSFFVLVLGISFLGLRNDLWKQLSNLSFIGELLLLLVLSISASFVAFKSCIPSKRHWGYYSFIIPLLVWISVYAYKAYQLATISDLPSTMVTSGMTCSTYSFLLSLLPLSIGLSLIQTSRCVSPKLTGVTVSFASATIGGLGLILICSAAQPFHMLLWHILPVIGIGCAGVIIGHTLFKW
ncbi:DUF1109 family protein [bacterium]|jgi:hypothetical protein|nr:DUF1109 family protein [bacterium]